MAAVGAWTTRRPTHVADMSTVARASSKSHEEHNIDGIDEAQCPVNSGRRSVLRRAFNSALLVLPTTSAMHRAAHAAPPMAIIAEELGYFPVTNRDGITTYVPARVKRESTEQAVALAKYLQSSGATMYGSYWCPHCARQKELFGRSAFSLVNYVECAPKGYRADPSLCLAKNVDGYPTWRFGNGKMQGGEMSLADIAKLSGYKGSFDGGLEGDLPSLGSSGSCR